MITGEIGRTVIQCPAGLLYHLLILIILSTFRVENWIENEIPVNYGKENYSKE